MPHRAPDGVPTSLLPVQWDGSAVIMLVQVRVEPPSPAVIGDLWLDCAGPEHVLRALGNNGEWMIRQFVPAPNITIEDADA